MTLFILFCLLSFYSFGTAMMDYFMLYPSRFLVGATEFVEYHKFLEAAILPISVFPFLLIIIMNIVLFWVRPLQVSRQLLWFSFACLIIDFASTVIIQAPWNFELSEGKNVVLMQKITDTNWLRVFFEASQVIIVFLLLKQMISSLEIRNRSNAYDAELNPGRRLE